MTQTFNEPVEIIGASDDIQLAVQGYSTQTQPLEAWQDNSGTTLVQVTGEGSLEIGNNLGGGAPHDALIQANYNPTLPTSGPTSAWHTLGQVTTTLSSLVTWVIHELQLLGTSGVSGLQTALRVKLTHSNTGISTSAELRALDVETVNQGGSGGSAVGQATGLHATVSNAAGAYLNKAVAVEVALNNDVGGSVAEAYGVKIPDLTLATLNYALYTGKGLAHLGDQLGIVGSGDRIQAFIQANATQTHNLQEWQNNAGSAIASIDQNGNASANAYKLPTAVATTLASDAFTVSKGFHVLSAQTGTADNLATINGGSGNLDITIQAASSHTITVKNGVGNVFLSTGKDFGLAGNKTLRLFFNGSNWSDLAPQAVSNLNVTTVEINFGSTPVRTKKFTVTDASVSTSSILIAQQSAVAATGKSQDENELDVLSLRCVPGAGNFSVIADALFGPVTGNFKINYLVQG